MKRPKTLRDLVQRVLGAKSGAPAAYDPGLGYAVTNEGEPAHPKIEEIYELLKSDRPDGEVRTRLMKEYGVGGSDAERLLGGRGRG